MWILPVRSKSRNQSTIQWGGTDFTLKLNPCLICTIIISKSDCIEGLNWWESSEDLNTLYLGLGGLAYGAEYREASVKTLRNPFNDLYGFIKQDRKRHSTYILGQ